MIDGDTLQIDGVTYRLWGIAAPGSGQPCADGWPTGRAATEHLRALIGERHVTCEPRSVDRYGRTVAVCHVDGRDLGADMVTDGHAWAFVRYSRDYVEEEREAAAVRAGIHEHSADLAKRIPSDAVPTAQIDTLRRELAKLVQVLAVRHRETGPD